MACSEQTRMMCWLKSESFPTDDADLLASFEQEDLLIPTLGSLCPSGTTPSPLPGSL